MVHRGARGNVQLPTVGIQHREPTSGLREDVKHTRRAGDEPPWLTVVDRRGTDRDGHDPSQQVVREAAVVIADFLEVRDRVGLLLRIHGQLPSSRGDGIASSIRPIADSWSARRLSRGRVGRPGCLGPMLCPALHDSGHRAEDADQVTATMAAWHVHQPGPVATSSPLVRASRPVPEAGPGEIRIAVSACGVCRTDLHLAEGDLQPHRPDCVPGHEVVGHVDQVSPGVTRFRIDDRVGIAWLRETCGHCKWCTSGRENLCLSSRYTGWDADGGYAAYAVVRADYAYALPAGYSDAE